MKKMILSSTLEGYNGINDDFKDDEFEAKRINHPSDRRFEVEIYHPIEDAGHTGEAVGLYFNDQEFAELSVWDDGEINLEEVYDITTGEFYKEDIRYAIGGDLNRCRNPLEVITLVIDHCLKGK